MARNRFMEDGVLRFGRYENEEVEHVAHEDPDYLRWMLRQIEDLPEDVSEEVGDALIDAGEPVEVGS